MRPKVSVCMPTYNLGKYLPEAIESVLRQTYKDFEFIIIDDCSQDDSAEIIRSYASRDARIRFTVNDSNVGMVNNWNLCLRQARGDYIKYLFGDDMLASETALEKFVAVLDSDEETVLVASSRYLIDEHSNVIRVLSEYKGKRKNRGTEVIKDCLLEQVNKIGEPSVVLFRRKNAERGFDGNYRQIVDLDMWFHILEQGDFVYIDEPICSFRIHPTQQTRLNLENCLNIEEPHLLLKDYADKPYVNFSRMMRAYMFYHQAYLLWRLHKVHQKISRQEATERMERQYGFGLLKFIFFPLVYRLFRSYMSIKRRITRIVHKQSIAIV